MKPAHLQVVFSAIQAPAMGPMAGPVKGARIYNDIAKLVCPHLRGRIDSPIINSTLRELQEYDTPW